MANRSSSEEVKKTRRPPATSPEGRENQLISLSVDLAEKQLREGTASSQVITHFLKMGSTREKLEQERIGEEVTLLKAKAEVLASEGRMEGLVKDALDAMRSYTGAEPTETFDD